LNQPTYLPVVRLLTPEDAPAYQAIALKGYRTHGQAFTSYFPDRAKEPLQYWQDRVSPANAQKEVVFGAFIHAQLVGVTGLSFETRFKVQHKANLFGVFVDAPFQGQGIARALVSTALTFARSLEKLTVVQLTVTDGNEAAIHLYESFGFITFGVEPMAIKDEGEFYCKRHMWLEL
jgi:RimJ/RimL family protein N-acetyltransferase